MDANPDEGGENWGELNVMLASDASSDQENATMSSMRSSLSQIPGLEYKFARPSLFTFSTPVEIEISGFNLTDLKEASDNIAHRLEKPSGLLTSKIQWKSDPQRFKFLFDRDRAAALGLRNFVEVADRIVSNMRGDIATRYTYRDRKIDVLVRSKEENRSSVSEIQQIIQIPVQKDLYHWCYCECKSCKWS